MKTYLVSFVLGVGGAALSALAEPLPLEVRQVVIRAPEMEVIRLITGPKKTEAERVVELRRAVKEGRASVISDVSSAADDGGRVRVKSGQLAWMPSELDQEMDRLFMVPTAFEERFIGTSLECQLQAWSPPATESKISAQWVTRYAPRGPETVLWPTSWLDVYDHKTNQLTDKAVHGWLDWRDLFEESVVSGVILESDEPKILAVMPPGDQVWPGDRKGRWLDVFIAEVQPPGLPKRLVTVEKPAMGNHTWLYGLALDSKAALALMRARKPGEDAALLQTLLTQVEEGSARMVLCAGSAQVQGQRGQLVSTRWHEYPTEMPSIPSAWEARAVGMNLEMDGGALSLRQAVAAPARSEWKLALDVPEAIMWQPRFRDFQIQTEGGASPGTRLLSVMQVPEVMQGEGLPKDETLLVFSQSEGPGWPEAPAPKRGHEAEIMVFEIPAREEAEWQAAAAGKWGQPDTRRLQALADRAQSGQSPLVAHVMLHLEGGHRATVGIAEDYPTATEFDPPHRDGSPRMRPTALETLPVGSRWELDLNDENLSVAEDPHLLLTHTFLHSTARPLEPGLKETLAIAADPKAEYPGAPHLVETWSEGSLKLVPGQVRCLGLRKPPGTTQVVRHVAFIQVRELVP